MTTEQARKIFDQVAETHRNSGNLDAAASVELVREYFTNAQFRHALADHVAALNGVA